MFEQISTEYADGIQNGVDYGSKIRVIMRSPERVAFVGYGIQLISRSDRYRATLVARDSKKDTVQSDSVRQSFIAAFGDGADEWAIKAITTRGKGTILVNGGGEPLPLPRAVRAKAHQESYEAVTPTATLEVSGQRTCVQCGEKLPLDTQNHSLGTSPSEGHPKTIEDCQRLTNEQVVGVLGYGSNYPKEWWPYVSYYFTWDGVSHTREYFCNDRCGALYGKRAVEELPLLQRR